MVIDIKPGLSKVHTGPAKFVCYNLAIVKTVNAYVVK